MSIYKKQSVKKLASIRQMIFSAIWGTIAGVYVFQPLLKALHRNETSIIADCLKLDDELVIKSTGHSIVIEKSK